MPGFVSRMIKAILFDLGGVLVELRGEAHVLPLIRGGMTREQLWQRWSASPAVRAHETGRIVAGEFAARIIRELDLNTTPEEFLRGFREWIVGPFAETPALIRDAAAHHITALLTNTSALHWPIIETMDIVPHMHHVVASHQVEQIKPDCAFFEHALDCIGVGADESMFFDDSALNVAAARELGIHAYQVDGANAARMILIAKGLIRGD